MRRIFTHFAARLRTANLTVLVVLATLPLPLEAQTPLPVLSAPLRTSNGFSFVLNGQSGVSYLIQSSSNRVDWITLMTNSNLGTTRTITITNPPAQQGFYRAVQVRLPVYGIALGAINGITLTGNARVDSYDSSVAPYSSSTPGTNAFVVSTSGSSYAIALAGSSHIYGCVATGPGGTIVCSGTSTVGDIAYINNNSVPGVESGHAFNDANISFPSITTPQFINPLTSLNGGTVGATNYTYVASPGKYVLSSLVLTGLQTMAVTGKTVIYVTSNFSIKNAAYLYVAPGASLTVYAGGTISIAGQGLLNSTQSATNCTIYGLSTCTNITYLNGSPYIGTIYAPQAALNFNGATSCYGAAIANSIIVSISAAVHYDESLAKFGPTR